MRVIIPEKIGIDGGLNNGLHYSAELHEAELAAVRANVGVWMVECNQYVELIDSVWDADVDYEYEPPTDASVEVDEGEDLHPDEL